VVVIGLVCYRWWFFSMASDQATPTYWINMGALAISTLARLQLLGVALILAGVLLATRKPAQASSADAITRSPCSRRRRSRSSAR
jgi:hypothetical protein